VPENYSERFLVRSGRVDDFDCTAARSDYFHLSKALARMFELSFESWTVQFIRAKTMLKLD
jgi:hypothetical protein